MGPNELPAETAVPETGTSPNINQGAVRLQYRTRHLLWTMTGFSILLGIPGLLWILLHFTAVMFLLSCGTMFIVVGILMVLLVAFLFPSLWQRLFGPREPLTMDAFVNAQTTTNPSSDA
jgi:hypothetical protein